MPTPRRCGSNPSPNIHTCSIWPFRSRSSAWGARSRKRRSSRSVHRSSGSLTCESAEKSLYASMDKGGMISGGEELRGDGVRWEESHALAGIEHVGLRVGQHLRHAAFHAACQADPVPHLMLTRAADLVGIQVPPLPDLARPQLLQVLAVRVDRSEEHTSELQ